MFELPVIAWKLMCGLLMMLEYSKIAENLQEPTDHGWTNQWKTHPGVQAEKYAFAHVTRHNLLVICVTKARVSSIL